MTITVDAIYENGMLKPVKPLPLEEHEKVTLDRKSTRLNSSH